MKKLSKTQLGIIDKLKDGWVICAMNQRGNGSYQFHFLRKKTKYFDYLSINIKASSFEILRNKNLIEYDGVAPFLLSYVSVYKLKKSIKNNLTRIEKNTR